MGAGAGDAPTLATAPHESKVQLNYTADGLSPFWGLRRAIQALDGGTSDVEVGVGGVEWTASLGYQQSGFAPRPSDTIESVHEYRFHLDGPGEKKADFHLRPRWDDPRADGTGAVTADGDTVSFPAGLVRPDGAVNVQVQGSNVALDDYPDLLAVGLAALLDAEGVDWNPRYFSGPPHGTSCVVAHERYVRVHRDRSRALVSMDGPLWNLRRLVGDRRGVRLEAVVDNREVVGKLHQVRLNRRAANELLPDPQRGKQLKHYHPRHVRSDVDADRNDPLAHPKLGALFSKALDDGRTVPWGERDALVRELEATVVNVLGWAGLPVVPDPTTYVADAHFDPAPSPRDVPLADDPTPEIEADQDATLARALQEMTDSDVAALEALTDGGPKDVDELAGTTGYAARTIYRVLDRLDGLLEKDGEGVQFVGEKLRRDAEEILAAADRQARRTIDRLADVAALADADTAAKAGRAFQQWLAKWGVGYDDPNGQRLRLRVGVVADEIAEGVTSCPHIGRILRRGLEAWVRAGRERERFLRATVTYEHKQVRGTESRDAFVGALLDDHRAPVA